MSTLHGKEIKAGNKVWNTRLGWELVRSINENSKYPIIIGGNAYTETGRLYQSDPNPSIYWEEMIITPKPAPEPAPAPVYEWQWLYWGDIHGAYYVTFKHYKSEGECLEHLTERFKSRPLIRIEESKREVKP